MTSGFGPGAKQISTHSLLAEGDEIAKNHGWWDEISTHSLLAEGDRSGCWRRARASYFNPLPPRGGRRTAPATEGGGAGYFNPLPPRGGRPRSIIAAA